jgi:hypothetical protein
MKTELKKVWVNPFPRGSREAMAESRRIVEEAVAETELFEKLNKAEVTP